MRAHAGGDFGARLRVVVERSLRDTSQFWTSVSIEGVTLEDEHHDRAIVVELRTSDHPQTLYRLRLKVEEYESNDSDPRGGGHTSTTRSWRPSRLRLDSRPQHLMPG